MGRLIGSGAGRVVACWRRGLVVRVVAGLACGVVLGGDDGVRVGRNFAAEYNARVGAVAESERAWPVYQRARMKLVRVSDELKEAGWPFREGDARWAEGVRNLEQNRECLELVRDGAARPRLGLMMSDQLEPAYEAFLAKERGELFEGAAASENPMLLDVLLPHLGEMRTFARLLLMHGREAGSRGDGDAVVEDVRTIMALGGHAGEPPILICALVQIAIDSLALDMLMEQLWKRPEMFSDDALASGQRWLEGIDVLAPLLAAHEHERTVFLDVLQRIYTDDGKGDGVLADEGMRLMGRLVRQNDGGAPVPAIMRPMIAGRAEMLAEFERVLGESKAAYEVPLWAWEEAPDARAAARFDAEEHRTKYMLAGILLPASTKAGRSLNQFVQQRDAAVAALALERHRRKHGGYPATLDALVPEFLGAAPRDRFDGNAMKYRVVDGRPRLYSVGADGDDDGGVYPEGRRWAGNGWVPPGRRGEAADADLVLFPVE